MSNFLRNLVARELGRAEVVEPRLVSRFEPPTAALPPRARAAPHDTADAAAQASEEIEITIAPAPPARPRPEATAPTRPDTSAAESPRLGAITPVAHERGDAQPRPPSIATGDNATHEHQEDAAAARPTADRRTSGPPVVAQTPRPSAPRPQTDEPFPTPPQSRKTDERDAITRAPEAQQGRGVAHEGRLRPPAREREEVVGPLIPPVVRPRRAPHTPARGGVGEEISLSDPSPRRAAPGALRGGGSSERADDAKRSRREVAPTEVAPRVGLVATPPPQQTENARRQSLAERQGEPVAPAPDGGGRVESPVDRPAPAERVGPRPPTVEGPERPRPVRPPGLTQGAVARPRVSRPAERGSARKGAAEPAPVINVTIGRVEVRASAGAPAAPQREDAVSSSAPPMSLDDYLRQRAGGGGGR